MRIALNGFGRIGKNFFHALLQDTYASSALECVAINIGPGDPSTIAYMVKYDTVLGTYQGEVTYENNTLTIDGRNIAVFAESDPTKLPWRNLNIDWVVEASGKFTRADEARKHMEAGAKKVLISAPASGDDITIIPGVNQSHYKSDKHAIVSLGSCTTNALMPLLKLLLDTYELDYGFMTTAHAYTNSQKLLDVNATQKGMRRSRAAALNIIPTSTGAVKTIGKVIPELEGKVNGCALRVPVPVVSLIDLTFTARKDFTREGLNALFKKASQTTLKTVLDISEEPLVSSDYEHNSHSVVVDAELTQVCGKLGKVFGWYDNEWGYSCRLKDFLIFAAR